MYQNVDVNTPEELLHQVQFDVMFQLRRRGRENMRDMTRETFAVGTDVRGRRFIYQATDELDKNHDRNDRTFETIGEASIYEVPGSPKCPVQNYLMFLSVINPKQNALGKNQKHQ